MRATKHTPGPWQVARWQRGEATPIYGADGAYRVASVHDFNAQDSERHLTNIANARLIATAPELLEALVKLANVFHEGQVFPRNGAAGYVEATLEAAELAIAKAAGEQP